MHRDPTLRKRNALVIPGVLLMVLSFIGILYVQGLRPDSVACDDGRLIVLAGSCVNATLVLAIPLALGIVLAIVGARFRDQGSCHLGHGTAAATGLALLIAFVTIPLLGALVVMGLQGDGSYGIEYNGLIFRQTYVLGGVALLGLLMLVPYLILYIGTAREPRCCRDKKCFEPCFCDEPVAPATTTQTTIITATPAPEPVPEPSPQPTWQPATLERTDGGAPIVPPPAPAEVVDDWGTTPPSSKPKAKPKPKKAGRKVSTKKTK